MGDDAGVVLPEQDGRRSTAAFGRAVVHDALLAVDPVGARAASGETGWRQGYLTHLRRLVEASTLSDASALTIARDGLASVHRRMRLAGPDGDRPLSELFDEGPGRPLVTASVRGTADAATELSVPLRGRRLRGEELAAQLDAWERAGVLEPSAAAAVREVVAHPEWLRLEGRSVVVLGAGAEMGPLRALLSWGATVIGVDLPGARSWRRLLDLAQASAGTLHLPARPDHDGAHLTDRAGVDLLTDLPALADWLEQLPGPLVLGSYVYADGARHVRVTVAVDALSEWLGSRRDDVALAWLATPTDVFAVPAETVAHSTRCYESRSPVTGLVRPALRAVSGGRLLRRNYPPGADPGINDSLVPQQGPNYALAKRVQRWRAQVARHDGATVSLNVAPPTRTRSVVRNRALAAAYAGAHRFGIEVFEPATANTLMAALLVHDLCAGRPALEPSWREEAHGAVHGGLWRTAYEPRSALGLAVVLGLGSARS